VAHGAQGRARGARGRRGHFRAGRYVELLRPLQTGTPDAAITFRAERR